MELLKLSKFKLQLQALIADVHELKERERSATEQLNIQLQKQKQSEEEFSWRIQQLEAEIGALVETRQKLERKVDYLQKDNTLLENKQKELKGAINNLLQSRECFVNTYEEAFSVQQVVDKVQQTVSEKENIGMKLYRSCFFISCPASIMAELRRKMEKVSSFEELFEEKISVLESKTRDQGKELQTKNKAIMELSAQLEAEKTRKNHNSEIEEISFLQNAILYDIFSQYCVSVAAALRNL
ncbi:hypothetical protein QQ045_000140 [Rhodiola kirilowii]